MTQYTISELSALRVNLISQINAIDTLLGGMPRKELDPPIEKLMPKMDIPKTAPLVKLKPGVKPKQSPPKKALWSKEDATKFIINCIKEGNGLPLSMDDLARKSPFDSSNRTKVKSILAMQLTSLFYGNVLTRIKKYSNGGHLCYHYKFP